MERYINALNKLCVYITLHVVVPVIASWSKKKGMKRGRASAGDTKAGSL